jgi:hypothetical protein
MAEIGFGKAPATTEAWGKEIGGMTFVFTKTREKERVFTYNCKRTSKDKHGITSDFVCGFQTDRDLDREEIESRPQFLEFAASQSLR